MNNEKETLKMMKRYSLRLALASFLMVAMLFALTSDATATNGYFSHGYGVNSKAMAGVAAAIPRDALVAATNPAGMFFIGQRFDLSVSLFNPDRQYSVIGNPSGMDGTFPLMPGTIESNSKLFVVPSVAGNWMINPKTSVGVSIYGNGGMNTNYDTKTFNDPRANVMSPTGVDLMQLFVSATVAREFVTNHAIGVTGIFAYQRFEARGLQAFSGISRDPGKLSDKEHDVSKGYGVRIGYMGKPVSGVNIGASYQTKMSMEQFEYYSGLFAEQGDFDIPANWVVGVAVKPTRTLTLAADVQQILYSNIRSIANPMNPQNFQQQPPILLGDDAGSGFGWEDMTIFKFGLEWEGIVDLPLMCGYSYGKQPIPESEMMFNILAPGVIEHHISFGFSHRMCGGKELSFAVTHALNNKISGPNPMEMPNQQTIELEMNEWEFSIGFAF